MAFFNLYLYVMTRNFGLLLFLFLLLQLTNAQVTYLNKPNFLNRVDSCLHHTYNFSFQSARTIQRELELLTPEHPAPPFLEALIVYWENFPLHPRDKAAESFVELMNRSITLAEEYIGIESSHLEGVFFDLFARAFKAMFWADNGKAAKVAPDLRTMYRHTKEGFKLMDQFVEFYFSTGLYNYYIEAYPEAHPVYKPMVSFMEDGNKELGLLQLNHAITHSTYIKVEAILFMSLIQLHFEEDLNSAAIYAERLYRDFPNNIYYQGHLIMILLHQHRYSHVREILEGMKRQSDTYSQMIRSMALAFIAEKTSNNDRYAGKEYMKTVELADAFGPFASRFRAIGYMGLCRLNAKKGLRAESRRYARKAAKFTSYRFILDE
jgi:hypothetical protein